MRRAQTPHVDGASRSRGFVSTTCDGHRGQSMDLKKWY
jgi:hypothetical protein